MPQHPFGEHLRRRRQHADLTIERLAERSGVSTRAISDIERGMSVGPQRRTVIALADALELTDLERTEFFSAARPGRRGATYDITSASIRPFRLPDFSGRETEMHLLSSLLSTKETATMATRSRHRHRGRRKDDRRSRGAASCHGRRHRHPVPERPQPGYLRSPLCRCCKGSCDRPGIATNQVPWKTPSPRGVEQPRRAPWPSSSIT